MERAALFLSCARGGGQNVSFWPEGLYKYDNPSVKNHRFLTAPFAQGSLWRLRRERCKQQFTASAVRQNGQEQSHHFLAHGAKVPRDDLLHQLLIALGIGLELILHGQHLTVCSCLQSRRQPCNFPGWHHCGRKASCPQKG